MGATNLQSRILTALTLIPLTVAGVLYLSSAQFALVLGALWVLAAWEWSQLGGLQGQYRILFSASLLPLLWVLWVWIDLFPPILWLGLLSLWWFGIAVLLLRISTIPTDPKPAIRVLLSAVPVLAGAWLALVWLHRQIGPEWVLFLLILIWTADSAAYFSGRRWGRARLAPSISPGKTWAGLYGALLGAGLIGFVPLFWHHPSLGFGVLFILLSMICAGVSILGDLFESFLKRRRGLKDSGQLLPGHGGLLDRIDSLLAAAPVFALGIYWLEGRW